jgi:hypothetical protein
MMVCTASTLRGTSRGCKSRKISAIRRRSQYLAKIDRKIGLKPLNPSSIKAPSALRAEGNMPYASGESPKVGDYVKNKFEQPGTATAVHVTEGRELVDVTWDERAVEALSIDASEFTRLLP